jgi:hypothetical protein
MAGASVPCRFHEGTCVLGVSLGRDEDAKAEAVGVVDE